MDRDPYYNEESRRLQAEFDTLRLADRLKETLFREAFTADDRRFIARQRMFFLASTDAEGFPDCSYKGGDPGFVRVDGDRDLVFPSYDGNGMFKSLGNIRANPNVGLLFIDFEQPRRLRVNGTARVSADDPQLAEFVGAQLLVRVAARRIFQNCARYVPRMQIVAESPHIPAAGHTPPTPEWKTRAEYNHLLPAYDPARRRDRAE